MSEELDILKIVAENPSISQRKIAEQTGISLGQVNFLIKKCVKKGLIKIEGQTTKSIKYNLTPTGMAEKAELTLEYIKMSYASVLALTDRIRALAEQYLLTGQNIYIYGSNDEMMAICKLAFGSRVKYLSSIDNKIELDSTGVVFYWEDKNKKVLESTGAKAVNLLQ